MKRETQEKRTPRVRSENQEMLETWIKLRQDQVEFGSSSACRSMKLLRGNQSLLVRLSVRFLRELVREAEVLEEGRW